MPLMPVKSTRVSPAVSSTWAGSRMRSGSIVVTEHYYPSRQGMTRHGTGRPGGSTAGPPGPVDASAARSRRYAPPVSKRWLPIALLAALLAAAWATGVYEHLTIESIRGVVTRAGWLGPPVFLVGFALEGLALCPAFPFPFETDT